MPESTSSLEIKRFDPTPESLSIMKNLRDSLDLVQKEHPVIKGLGFFGSRTKGQEKPESDLDLIVFFDRYLEFNNEGKFFTGDNIREWFKSNAFLDVDHYGMFHSLDISKQGLDSSMKRFIFEVQDIAKENNLSIDQLETTGIRSDISQIFALSVGEQVYKARQYVLDQFKDTPDGDIYFRLLMKQLSEGEREKDKHNSPQYINYPKTIEEAETFFINKDYTLDEIDTPWIPKIEKSHNNPNFLKNIRRIFLPKNN